MPPAVQQEEGLKESTIRLMTRLAIEYDAVNLSQGFPNQPPPRDMACAAAGAVLSGSSSDTADKVSRTLEKLIEDGELLADISKEDSLQKDTLSQYTFPFGMPALRQEIQAYYARFYPGLVADAEKNITVCLGATEGFAASLRTICSPGDRVVFFEPFHELYPNQCLLWYLKPEAVTLREDVTKGTWTFDEQELDKSLAGAKMFLLNTPHNPTGKVFSQEESEIIAKLCIKHDVICCTDEIYEHLLFDGAKHVPMACLPGMAERTFVVDSLSKTARATGWRVGWVVCPEGYTQKLRSIHDQLVVQAPTPMQFASMKMLRKPDDFFDRHRAEYVEKLAILLPALLKAGFKIAAKPQGSYYLFADYSEVALLKGLGPEEAAVKMLKEIGIACVPGDNFYLGASKADPETGGKYLRFAFVRSPDVLKQAVERLQERM